MRPIYVTYAPSELDADGVAQSQTPSGAGALTLNGALVSGGVATFGAQQYVTIFSGSNISNRTFVIVGTDGSGNALSETITGPNNTTVATVSSFKTVTSITISGTAAGALTVGVNGLGYSAPIVLDQYVGPMNTALYFIPTGTITAKVQDTGDDIFATSYNAATGNWIDHPTMTGMSTAQNGNYAFPPRAIRLNVTAATAGTPDPSAVLQVIQSNVT